MVRRRIDEAASAMNGEVIHGDPAAIFDRAVLDSRSVRGGELFFALAGEHADGHDFVVAALEAGSAGAVIGRAGITGVEALPGAVIRVADPYRALHDLTRHVRRSVPERLIAVTGSSGKTTTKDFLAALLALRYRTAATPGNLNNLYGFPLSLLGVPDDTEWMVAEMGMSVPGELAEVSRLGTPDVALFTNVRAVHLAGFEGSSVEEGLLAIAAAKAELLAGLARSGRIVANAGDRHVVDLVHRHQDLHPEVRVTWFAGAARELFEQADFRATKIEPLEPFGCRFLLTSALDAGPVRITLRVHGEVNVENFVAAAACARVLGVPLTDIAKRADTLVASHSRGQIRRGANGARVIDDSYNSNPDAASAALRSASALSAGRHGCVLGDMLELGEKGPEYHEELGRLASELGFALVVGVGPLAEKVVAAAREHARKSGSEPGPECVHLETAEQAAAWLAEAIQPDDVWLVKGSRGIGLERVVRAVVESEGEVV